MQRAQLLASLAAQLNEWPKPGGGISPASIDREWRWTRRGNGHWVMAPRRDAPLQADEITESDWLDANDDPRLAEAMTPQQVRDLESSCIDCGAPEGASHHHNCARLEQELWAEGEARIDRIAQSDASGEHYLRDVAHDHVAEMADSGDHYQQGRKDDAAKPRLDLLLSDMPHALEAIAMVPTRGAEKYAPGNWMDVPDAQRRYLAAGARHELEFAKGVHHDAETGEHHLAHAACCLLFRLELLLREDF